MGDIELDETERGNTLMSSDWGGESNMAAWIKLGPDRWLEIVYLSDCYPALRVRTVKKTQGELKDSIRNQFADGDWQVLKNNLELPVDGDGRILDPEEENKSDAG